MRRLFLFYFLILSLSIQAQEPEKLSTSEIYQKLKELNFLGSVLYVGAHPDDENTRLISYFSNEVNARTAYLSLTRGDGGQNLIGPEIREQLGVIRTQELLAARRIDGGEQFFSRANDFGYSKTPSETLEIWNKDQVLSDVVWAIRKFQPDVIINRFDHRTPGTTHGHHTSSAVLSVEAFDLASNPDAYSQQLKYTGTWKPKRLFFNTSPWFYGGEEAFEAADKSKFISFDTGVYFPLKGLSNPEISSLSRSQHQSQGFGSTGSRGSQMEYLELIKGEMPGQKEDVFAGIDTSWNRVEGGAEIREIINNIIKNYNFTDPSASLPQLMRAYQLIQNLENEHWKKLKSDEIKEIIAACSGLYLEAVATEESAIPSEQVPVKLEAINRSDEEMKLTSVELTPNNSELQPDVSLQNNKDWHSNLNLKIPSNARYTSPYWLKEEGSIGMYKVEDQELIGLPETPFISKATFNMEIQGIPISFERPIVYKYNAAVGGETYQSFEITPPVSLKFDEDVMIFDSADTREISVTVTAWENNLQGVLNFSEMDGWKIDPKNQEFNIPQKGASARLNFSITPPASQQEIILHPEAKIGEKVYSDKIIQIDYSHIPLQTLVIPSQLKLVKINIEKRGEKIGYIEGAGDLVPESLEQIGYQVTKIDPAAISPAVLENFDAVVVGIRAYNTVEELKYKQPILLDYVKNGGTLILQYNTSHALLTQNLSPFQLNLSRDRVTEENAEVRFLAPEHPLLNYPNQITKTDFEGWVQERGLYFPNSWGEEFTPILSMNDKDESPKNGSLLVASYGEGYYIYTGLSFFREFPAGVPGAFRLFANLLSIGK